MNKRFYYYIFNLKVYEWIVNPFIANVAKTTKEYKGKTIGT
jgi:hypothetical protein